VSLVSPGKEDESVGGCILAHSMGLGKTLQTITFLSMFHNQHPNTQSLVVLPANVLANWKQASPERPQLFRSLLDISPRFRLLESISQVCI
jgi:SNF2 family DNA or RNA helicase